MQRCSAPCLPATPRSPGRKHGCSRAFPMCAAASRIGAGRHCREPSADARAAAKSCHDVQAVALGRGDVSVQILEGAQAGHRRRRARTRCRSQRRRRRRCWPGRALRRVRGAELLCDCDLYDPTPLGKCRRFEDGILAVPRPGKAPVAEIKFRRWGKLETQGNRRHCRSSARARRRR